MTPVTRKERAGRSQMRTLGFLTKQGETRQDKTTQDKTRQDNTTQHNRRQQKTR